MKIAKERWKAFMGVSHHIPEETDSTLQQSDSFESISYQFCFFYGYGLPAGGME